jgi:hypothetical protein
LSLFFALLSVYLLVKADFSHATSIRGEFRAATKRVSELWHQPERPVFHYSMPTDFMFVFCLLLAAVYAINLDANGSRLLLSLSIFSN